MSDGRETPMISLREHPRAAGSIRRTKAWGGLLAFGVTAYVSHRSGMGVAASGFRALGAGIVGYLLTWSLAIVFWRALVRAEAKAAIERVRIARAEMLAARQASSERSS